MPNPPLMTDRFFFFWGSWPSQWFKADFTIDGVTYNCCEQYMMAEKARLFSDGAAEAEILAAKDPGKQKAIGRRVKNFDPARWNEVCRGIVYTGNLAKFRQHAQLASYLLDTGERTIVEASPTDRIWGIGLSQTDERAQDPAKWEGTNWLGVAHMQVRDQLLRDAGKDAPPMDEELQQQLTARDTQRL